MSSSTPTPNIDWNTAQANAQQAFNTLNSLLQGWGMPGWLASRVAGAIAGLVFVATMGVITILQAVVAVATWFAALFLETLDTVKEDNRESLNDLLAATTNELLGTSLTGDQLTGGSGGGSTWDVNQTIGNSLISLFEQAFGGGAPVSPAQGQQNAYKFAGFAINFATTQGFFSILAEAASIGFLKEFHELPDGLMHSLGLGRLQRLALQPLIRNAVQQPYDLYLKSVYRPDRLSEGDVVKFYHQGDIDQGDAQQRLAEKGYPDDIIALLLQDTTPKLGTGDLVILLSNSQIQQQDAINNLTIDGVSEDSAKLQLTAALQGTAKAHTAAMLAALQTAYVAGFITEDTWNTLLKGLPLSDEEDQAYRNVVGFLLETPAKTVGLGDVQKAIVDGITDFAYLDKFMQAERYDADSQTILTYLTIEKMSDAALKEKSKQWKAAQLQAKGKPVPPWLQG